MAKRPDLSSTQRKIVSRYYDNLDTITVQKLAELVSELYLAEGKAADRLWKRAETALAKTSVGDATIRRILETRDIAGLAKLVSKLT